MVCGHEWGTPPRGLRQRVDAECYAILHELRACHDEAPEGLWDGVTELGARGVWSALWNTRYNESTGLYE